MTMKPEYGSGLMAFWADVEEAHVLFYQQWHNCEHIPERVSIPGFLRGRRYRDIGGAPHFLMMYETRDPSVLASDAYLARLNQPTEWTRKALSHFRNPSRGIYSLAESAGEEGPFCAGWLTTLRFSLDGGADSAQVRRWLSAMSAQPHIGRVQLWQADVAVSGIQTSERGIYGGSAPGDHLLLIIEASEPHAAQSDPLAAGDASVPELARRSHEMRGCYFLEIFHHSPAFSGESV